MIREAETEVMPLLEGSHHLSNVGSHDKLENSLLEHQECSPADFLILAL